MLVAVSCPVPGSRHDSAALRLCGWDVTLTGADWIAGAAYTAHGALTPIKKSPTEIAWNGRMSSIGLYILQVRHYRAHDRHLEEVEDPTPWATATA